MFYSPNTSVEPPNAHADTRGRHCSPWAPSLRGSDLSALPVRSSLFKEFHAVRRTRADAQRAAPPTVFIYFFPSYLREIKSIFSVGVAVGGGGLQTAQHSPGLPHTDRAGRGHLSGQHTQHYRHAPCRPFPPGFPPGLLTDCPQWLRSSAHMLHSSPSRLQIIGALFI